MRNSKEKVKESQKAITLIALVITIIVLLILAGVTIATLSGDNSAPQKATEAAQKDAIAEAKDEIVMEAQEALLNYYNNEYVKGKTTTGASTQLVVKEAAINALKNAKTRNTQLLESSEVNGNTITLNTKSYTVTGTIETNGGIIWSDTVVSTGGSENVVEEVVGSNTDWEIDASTHTIIRYIGDATEDTIVVPNYVEKDGEKVQITALGNGSAPIFTDQTAIQGKKLEISEGIENINNNAFAGCRSFTGDLIIPNSVTTIGDFSFVQCAGFDGKLVIGNKVQSLGVNCFSACSGFEKLVIGEKVQTIGNTAFAACSGFTGDLIIPNSVETLGEAAFGNCSNFTGLVISNKLKTIPKDAFGACKNLTGEVVIPDGVTTITSGSFKDCSKLSKLTISKSVTTIEGYSFEGCVGLESVIIQNEEGKVTIGNLAFDSYVYNENKIHYQP